MQLPYSSKFTRAGRFGKGRKHFGGFLLLRFVVSLLFPCFLWFPGFVVFVFAIACGSNWLGVAKILGVWAPGDVFGFESLKDFALFPQAFVVWSTSQQWAGQHQKGQAGCFGVLVVFVCLGTGCPNFPPVVRG